MLLSLLKYFRSKGSCDEKAQQLGKRGDTPPEILHQWDTQNDGPLEKVAPFTWPFFVSISLGSPIDLNGMKCGNFPCKSAQNQWIPGFVFTPISGVRGPYLDLVV